MMSTLCGGETATLRDDLRAVIDHSVVVNHVIRIFGSKQTLARAPSLAGQLALMFAILNRNGAPCGNRTRLCNVRGCRPNR